MYKIKILDVPLDLGQERCGVDMGPSAVRAAGLNHALKSLGHDVHDSGNIHVRPRCGHTRSGRHYLPRGASRHGNGCR
jgi:arginase family enzyme